MSEKNTTLSEEEISELILKYRIKARKLARCILRQWRSTVDLQEVDSIVDLSLCESAYRYNPEFGASFMTFFYFHLRGNLIRAISEAVTGNGVVNPEEEEQSERPVTTATDASSSNRNKARVARASDVSDYYYGHTDSESPDQTLQQVELSRIVREACEKLDPTEREIIVRIFLDEQQIISVAKNMGYSRCHISRLKKRALEALSIHLATTQES
jgi:RNA polymerase sigma factor (sigma-70 family)